MEEAAKDIREALKSPEIEHRWQQEKCGNALGLQILGGSRRTRLEFSGNDFTKTDEYFSSTDCIEPSITIKYNGTFEKKEEVQKNVYQIDFKFLSSHVVAENETGKRFLNTARFFGKEDWVEKVDVDVTGSKKEINCPIMELSSLHSAL